MVAGSGCNNNAYGFSNLTIRLLTRPGRRVKGELTRIAPPGGIRGRVSPLIRECLCSEILPARDMRAEGEKEYISVQRHTAILFFTSHTCITFRIQCE